MPFRMDASQLSRQLYAMERRTLGRMTAYAQTAAKQLEATAKAEAPWTDRTAHARGGLTGSAARSGSVIRITLSGSVRYLVYLELAHGKRFAVLWPTMQKHQQRILNGFARVASSGGSRTGGD